MKSRIRKRPTTQLRVERLESRLVLAGNLTVSTNASGDLIIRGDAADNCVEVITPAPGVTTISGCFNAVDDTTINGVALPLTTMMFTRDLKIDLKGGDDQVFLGSEVVAGTVGITVPRDLHVKTGHGADAVDIVAGMVGGDTEIETGLHDDEVTVRFDAGFGGPPIMFTGDLSIDTSDGMDIVSLDFTEVSGDTEIETGLDDDRVTLNNSGFAAGLEVETSRGNDGVDFTDVGPAGDTRIDTSDGDDDVFIGATGLLGSADPRSTFASLEISTGLHNDTVAIGNLGGGTGVLVAGDLEIGTSKGDDDVHLIDVEVLGETEVATSDGIDCVEILDSIFADLEVNLGKHNDHLLIGGTTIGGDIDLIGSRDTDTFYDGMGNTTDGVTPLDLLSFLRQFENVAGVLASFPCPF